MRHALLIASVVALWTVTACGLVPETVSREDPRLRPVFEAMARIEHEAMGFTALSENASFRVEFGPRSGYDA
jgi:hypothetical protein